MNKSILLSGLGLAVVGLGLIGAQPARADDWHGHEGREFHEHRDFHDRDWYLRHHYPPPPVAYAPPPPVAYVPPPVAYPAPGINLVLPIHIR